MTWGLLARLCGRAGERVRRLEVWTRPDARHSVALGKLAYLYLHGQQPVGQKPVGRSLRMTSLTTMRNPRKRWKIALAIVAIVVVALVPLSFSITNTDVRDRAFLLEPTSQHSVLRSLWTLAEIPDSTGASASTVRPGINADWAFRKNGIDVDANLVHWILESASIIEADDPRIRQWHFARWFDATWMADKRQWRMRVYLGGLAVLESSEKRGVIFYSLDNS